MRPVNLLPTNLRPRKPSAAQDNSAYVALGILGALLLALVFYVLTLNQIASGKGEITELRAETEQANRRSADLAPFGDFERVKQTRVASVKQLATTRLDWERHVRELAKVLPSGVWLTKLDATSPTDSTQSATSSGEITDAPTLTLTGCAPRQRDVATTVLRLRQLHLADEVSLDESTKADAEANGGAGGSSPAPSASGPDAAAGCATGYTFSVTVLLESEPVDSGGADSGRVAASLGGGS